MVMGTAGAGAAAGIDDSLPEKTPERNPLSHEICSGVKGALVGICGIDIILLNFFVDKGVVGQAAKALRASISNKRRSSWGSFLRVNSLKDSLPLRFF